MMSPRRLSTCPGFVYSLPGRARWAVVFGRPISQIGLGLGSITGEAWIAIAGEMNAIEISIAAANLRMVTPFGPDLLPCSAHRRTEHRGNGLFKFCLESPHLAAFRQPARRRTTSITTRRRSSTLPGFA